MKIITCNECGHEFETRQKSDYEIKCPECGSNASLSIRDKECLCEVLLHFKVPAKKAEHIFNARDELFKAGISFDTGGSNDGEYIELDWELDWSLRGGMEVFFKRFKKRKKW